MNYLHEEFDLAADDVIEVEIANPAHVRLMNDANFELYKGGKPYEYRGGHMTKSPVRFSLPAGGHWHVVIDLGGFGGRVSARVNIISRVHA